MTGVTICKDGLWYIAQGVPKRPWERDYTAEYNRFIVDTETWFSYIHKAQLIQISYNTLTPAEKEFIARTEGMTLEYEILPNGRFLLLSCRTRIGRSTRIDSPVVIIVSRYNEDVSWVPDYTNNYLIYNKGETLENIESRQSENIGGNQYDICRYIIDNYNNLPELMCFIQGFPFDHCNKTVFDSRIENRIFTPLESYIFENNESSRMDTDGGYMERNTNWFIEAHNNRKGLVCKWNTYDTFMHELFSDYQHLEWIRFTPGSQYIVTRENCLKYSKEFWMNLMNILPTTEVNGGTEAHLIERALYYIFTGTYTARI